jgi:hypothetical protein
MFVREPRSGLAGSPTGDAVGLYKAHHVQAVVPRQKCEVVSSSVMDHRMSMPITIERALHQLEDLAAFIQHGRNRPPSTLFDRRRRR